MSSEVDPSEELGREVGDQAVASPPTVHDDRIALVRRLHEGMLEIKQDPAQASGDLDTVARNLTELAAELIKVERVGVWLLNEDRTKLRLVELFERTPGRHSAGVELDLANYSNYIEALETSRVIDAHDAWNDPRTAEFGLAYFEPHGIASLLDAGIHVAGKLVGVVCHEHCGQVRRWTEEEMVLSGIVADQVAQTLLHSVRQTTELELQQSRRELAEANRMLQLVLDTIPVRVFWKDRESRFLGCNRLFAEDAGRESPTELIGDTDFNMAWSEQADLYRADDRQVVESGVPKLNFEEPQTTPEGEHIWLRTSKIPLKNLEGETIGMLGTYEDITERKQAEKELAEYRDHLEEMVAQRTEELVNAQEQLVRAERLATLGRLTASVAHELRNPLGTVQASVFSIRDAHDRGQEERFAKALRLAERNVARCDAIIEELLHFSRRRPPNPEPCELDRWIASILDEVQLPANVEVVRDLHVGRQAPVDREQFRRAFLNVFQNAVHAVQEREEGPQRVDVSSAVRAGRLEVCVQDNGVGMSEETLSKIHEPLYSTKSFGVGLGVPIVKEILEAHGGGVEFESEEGKGTRVLLWFPLEPSPQDPSPQDD